MVTIRPILPSTGVVDYIMQNVKKPLDSVILMTAYWPLSNYWNPSKESYILISTYTMEMESKKPFY